MVYKIDPDDEVCLPPIEKEIFVALVGQPNVGKSTVFNILTGLSQHVGNWPGKTVEKKEGTHRADNVLIRIVDLPGTYSLTAFSEEERVARDFIIKEKPDLVVLVIKRGGAGKRPLSFIRSSPAESSGHCGHQHAGCRFRLRASQIDTRALQDSLGMPVIPMVAKRNSGIKELVNQIAAIASCEYKYQP
ncbi:MAG: 50S ribosome-binding GTPase [Desulfobacterales bacterium]|nr:50S ribosome-binding GTPase [Desulfobacterales bacterium]